MLIMARLLRKIAGTAETLARDHKGVTSGFGGNPGSRPQAGLECGGLSRACIAECLERSLWVVLMHVWKEGGREVVG